MLPIFTNFKFLGLQMRSNDHFESRFRNNSTSVGKGGVKNQKKMVYVVYGWPHILCRCWYVAIAFTLPCRLSSYILPKGKLHQRKQSPIKGNNKIPCQFSKILTQLSMWVYFRSVIRRLISSSICNLGLKPFWNRTWVYKPCSFVLLHRLVTAVWGWDEISNFYNFRALLF